MDSKGRLLETRAGIPANGVLQLGGKYIRGIYYLEATQGSEKVVVKLVKL